MRWLVGRVAETIPETPVAVTVQLDLPDWPGHRTGQHVDVRLTAEDGYSAQRSYSIASAPDAERLALTIARIDDGEVPPYLTTVLDVGDELELRGPIGGYFGWEPVDTRPVLLAGGGSGVVPLMAMLRQARGTGPDHPLRLVVSVRTPEDLLYADELPGPDVTVVHTRRSPPGCGRPAGRLTLADLPAPPAPDPRAYVCGSSGFADAATDLLIRSGIPAGAIRVERFGPSAIAFPQ